MKLFTENGEEVNLDLDLIESVLENIIEDNNYIIFEDGSRYYGIDYITEGLSVRNIDDAKKREEMMKKAGIKLSKIKFFTLSPDGYDRRIIQGDKFKDIIKDIGKICKDNKPGDVIKEVFKRFKDIFKIYTVDYNPNENAYKIVSVKTDKKKVVATVAGTAAATTVLAVLLNLLIKSVKKSKKEEKENNKEEK